MLILNQKRMNGHLSNYPGSGIETRQPNRHYPQNILSFAATVQTRYRRQFALDQAMFIRVFIEKKGDLYILKFSHFNPRTETYNLNKANLKALIEDTAQKFDFSREIQVHKTLDHNRGKDLQVLISEKVSRRSRSVGDFINALRTQTAPQGEQLELIP